MKVTHSPLHLLARPFDRGRLAAARGQNSTILMVSGVLLAVVAGFIVLGLGRQSRVVDAQVVPQMYVVMAAREIPEHTTIRPDALTVKPFPAAFAPPGAATKIEDVAGKFATTRITRDQIVLDSQASTTKRTSNLSASIPPDKVAFWMPMPDLLAQTGGLKAADRVDILLSLALSEAKAGAGEQSRGITTQTTLQNVEVFFVGAAANVETETITAAQGNVTGAGAKTAARVIVFLLDPQEAVLAKFIKDSGGTIDLVLRSDAAPERITEAVTADTLVERFKFRVPERWSAGAR